MTTRERPKRTIKLKSPLIPISVVLLIGVQLFFPNKSWMILLSGLGSAWLISYLWARSLKKGLRLERDMRFGWKQVGDHVEERVIVANDGWAPGLWVSIIDQSDMQDYEISAVRDVNGWKDRHWHTRGFCTHRGIFTLGPTSLEAGDPLGIYTVRVEYSESVNMVVAPQVISLPEIEIAPGGRVGEGRSYIRGLEQAVTAGGVREYVPGDNWRWIHWPTTARKNEPYVHLFDNEPSSDWWVVLDMDPAVHVGEGQRSTEEYGVILAASLVNHGLHMGKAVGLVSYGDDLLWHTPDLGDAHLWKILRSLASVKPGGPPLAELLDKLRGSLGTTSLVIITPNLSPEWLNALELIKRSGIVPTVILIDPTSFGGFGNIQTVRDRLIRLGITHYTITSDLLDNNEAHSKKPWDWWIYSTMPDSSSRGARKPFWRRLGRVLRTGGLLFLIFMGLVTALGNAVRGIENDLLWFTTLAGLIFGSMFAYSSLPGWAYALINTTAGIGLITIRVGRLGNLLFTILSHLINFISQAFQWFFNKGEQPEAELLRSSVYEFGEKINLVGARLWTWISSLFQGEEFFDPVATAFLWSLLVWGSVIWAIWGISRRKKPILSAAPALLVVAISLIYFQKSSYDLVLMLGATIALTVFLRHDVRESFWEESRLYYDTTIQPKIMVAAVLLAIGLMLVSILSPSISINSIKDFINDLTGSSSRDQSIARSLGLDTKADSQDSDILGVRQFDSLPNRHLIGSDPRLSDQVVIVLQYEGWQGGDPGDIASQLPTYRYIRSLTYDGYTGYGWASRSTIDIDYDAGEQILISWPDNYRLVRQKVEVAEDLGGLIYAAGVPINADQDFRIAWRVRGIEHGVFDIFGGTISGEIYRVDSIVPTYSEAELRSAGQAYPDWLEVRYLGLPTTVPDTVLSLARDLTATEPTPYDRAVALERYLRTFPYTLNVDMPPAGQDITEHFLFTLQKGYCDYYATAMVVLARASGLPARLVIGYVAGNYDETRNAYVITADQAHAWAEVYFPEYGWIPFEPTGGQPIIHRPSEPLSESLEEVPADLKPLILSRAENLILWLKKAGGILLILISLALMVGIVFDWLLFLIAVERLLPKLFKRLYRYGRWIGVPIKPGETAYEYSTALSKQLQLQAHGRKWRDWLLIGVEKLQILTGAFIILMFKPQMDSMLDAKEITRTYKILRRRLWFLLLLTWVNKYTVFQNLFWRFSPSSEATLESGGQ